MKRLLPIAALTILGQGGRRTRVQVGSDLGCQRREQGTMLTEQLDEALEEMHVSKGRAKNPAAEGLIDDTTQHLEEVEDGSTRYSSLQFKRSSVTASPPGARRGRWAACWSRTRSSRRWSR
jgi:hypothetical protein